MRKGGVRASPSRKRSPLMLTSRLLAPGWYPIAVATAVEKFAANHSYAYVSYRDTVDSVGIISKRLPFTASNTDVKYFRRAISLDERRARFRPSFWNRPTPGDVQRGTRRGEMPKSGPRSHREKFMRELERQCSDGGEYQTDVEEVWFSGCHAGEASVYHFHNTVTLLEAGRCRRWGR